MPVDQPNRRTNDENTSASTHDLTLPGLSASKSAKSAKTREKIIQATLQIIARDGMRAVRHRAVAELAGVPLGATTYHFTDINDLITQAFRHWQKRSDAINNPFAVELIALLSQQDDEPPSEARRQELALNIYRFAFNYILDQTENRREDRIIELAFYHEAMQSELIRALVEEKWRDDLSSLIAIHTAMGTPCPQEDAKITLSLFLQLEREMVISKKPSELIESTKKTLRRHISLCTSVGLDALNEE